MRTKAYHLKKRIFNQEEKDIRTSCTVPNWQYYRSKQIRYQLNENLKNTGLKIFIVEGVIEQLALKLLIRDMRNNKVPPKRTIKYNQAGNSYLKINLAINRIEDYFLFRTKRNTLRISVSALMDIALRLYLKLAARMLFLKLTGSRLKKKWHYIIQGFSNYEEHLMEISNNCLIFTEIHKFP